MLEKAKHLFAATALSLAPLGTAETYTNLEPAFIKEEDEANKTEVATGIVPCNKYMMPEAPKVQKIGNFVHRMAGRNNQIGHRFRG